MRFEDRLDIAFLIGLCIVLVAFAWFAWPVAAAIIVTIAIFLVAERVFALSSLLFPPELPVSDGFAVIGVARREGDARRIMIEWLQGGDFAEDVDLPTHMEKRLRAGRTEWVAVYSRWRER